MKLFDFGRSGKYPENKPSTQNSFSLTSQEEKKKVKIDWYWALVFSSVWYILFYVTVIPSFYYYPTQLQIKDADKHIGEFIGERAENDLLALASLGVKIVGSQEYFNAIKFMMERVEDIKANARTDLYDIEIELQTATGEFIIWDSLIAYEDIYNIIAKVKPRNAKSDNALLINSHYDSEILSPAAGDAGLLIVIMLETMRSITQANKALEHTIIFLFNGGEENPMMGSHAFIAHHRWAKDCKALINLDSAGNGGREILFQSGPNHPWLMKYYRQSIPSPFASTVAEELFQNNFIPSDTDFRIFRDYGGVPGLDMAHTYGGQTYHTQFDTFANIPAGSYQLTGNNVLALTKSLANAPELDDPEKYAEGHTVFYDMVGWFLVFYTENQGIIINSVVSAVALIFIFATLSFMKRDLETPLKKYSIGVVTLFCLQVVSIFVAVGICVLMAVIIDAMGLALSWYTNPWLIFGLYYCPAFFSLGFGPCLYLTLYKKTEIPLTFSVQILMHAHCFVLTLFTIILTAMEIRSAFIFMVAVFFYTISMIINLVTKLYKKEFLWAIPHCLCQILPFWFYTYLCYAFLITFVPMQARVGPADNPEMFIAIFVVLFSILLAGFIIPLFNLFRKSKLLFSCFAFIFVLFVIIAATPAGFPYKEKTAPQRFYVLHTNRIFREFDGSVRRNESGYFVMPVDRRPKSVKDYVLDFDKAIDNSEDCANELYCGLPLYSGRWLSWGKSGSYFIPATAPKYSNYPRHSIESNVLGNNKKKFKLEVHGPKTFVLFIKPLGDAKLITWSRSTELLETAPDPPYFLYYSYAEKSKPFEIELEFERSDPASNTETFQIAICGHWLFNGDQYTEDFNRFLGSWPDWTYQTSWFTSYESFIY